MLVDILVYFNRRLACILHEGNEYQGKSVAFISRCAAFVQYAG